MSASIPNSAYKSGWASSGQQGTPVQQRAKAAQLDEFDPAQFDIDFSSASSKNSQPPTPKEKGAYKEDKQMVDQLGAIAGLMKRIDNQLANKDKLLNSAATTPAAGAKGPQKNWILQFASPNQPQKQQLAPIKENDGRNSAVNPKQKSPSPLASLIMPPGGPSGNQENRPRQPKMDSSGRFPAEGAPDSRPSTNRDRDRLDSDRNPSSDRSRSRDPYQSAVSGQKDYRVPSMQGTEEVAPFNLPPFKEDRRDQDSLHPSGRKPSGSGSRKPRDDLDNLKYTGPSSRKSTDTYVPRGTPLQSEVFSKVDNRSKPSFEDEEHQPRFFDEARKRQADRHHPGAVARNNFKDDEEDLAAEDLPDYGDFDNMSFSDMPTNKGRDKTPAASQAPADSHMRGSKVPTDSFAPGNKPSKSATQRKPPQEGDKRRSPPPIAPDARLENLRFDSEEDSAISANKSRDKSKGPDSARDKLNLSGRPGSDKILTDRLESDRAPSDKLAGEKVGPSSKTQSQSGGVRPSGGNQQSIAEESKQPGKKRQPSDKSSRPNPDERDYQDDRRHTPSPEETKDRKERSTSKSDVRDSSGARKQEPPKSGSRQPSDKPNSRTQDSAGKSETRTKDSRPPEAVARREGPANIDSRTSSYEHKENPKSQQKEFRDSPVNPSSSKVRDSRKENTRDDNRRESPRDLARRDGPAEQEYRESRAEVRRDPKSRETSPNELAKRDGPASQEYRESRTEYKSKPKSRDPSGRDLPPRSEPKHKEHLEEHIEHQPKSNSREPSPRDLARRDGAATQEYRESKAEYRKNPKSREPSARDMPPRTEPRNQEYRESYQDVRKPSSKEPSAKDLPPRTDPARQEYRESYHETRKPSSREPSARDMPPRTDPANQEYRESYHETRKPSSREPSARELAPREDAKQMEGRTSSYKQEKRNSRFAEDEKGPTEDAPQGLAPRDAGSRNETKTSTFYYKRPSQEQFEDEKRSSRKSSHNPESARFEKDSRKSFDDRDDSGRNRANSKKQSYDVNEELVDSQNRDDGPSVQLLVPPKKQKQPATRSEESSSTTQNWKLIEPDQSSKPDGNKSNNHFQQNSKALLGVPKSIEQSKLIDPLVIPILTYPKLKNFRKKGHELDEDSSEEFGESQAPEDAKIKEEIKAAEKAQNIDEILNLGTNIINDLEASNGKHHPYVANLSKMNAEVEAYREELKQKEPSPAAYKKLEEFVEKLKKLEVKEQKYASNNEKNKLEGLMRRKSMQRILTENVEDNPEIAGKSIVSPDRTAAELENYVITFLKDYSDRVSRLNTPTSTAFAEAANDTIELVPQVEKERSDIQHKELLRLLAHSIHQRFHDEAASPTLESPKTPSDIGAEDNNVVEFGHFLRSLNKLSQIPFKELDDMVSEPSCKINLFKLREELIDKKKVDPTKEKENDLTVLNGFKDDKKAIQELVINLGKEILPPLNFVENHDLDDSVPHVQFFDLKKQDSFNFGPSPTQVDNSGFDDDFSFTPTTKKVENPPQNPPNNTVAPANKPPALGDLSGGGAKKQNKFNHIEPKVFESEDEYEGFRPTSLISGTESDTTRRTKEDPEKNYRYDLVDEVEFQIEKVQDELSAVKDLKELIREETKRPTHPDKVPTALLDSVHNTLDRVHEFEEYSQSYEPLYLEMCEKMGTNSEPKGFLRIWPKYMRELARLKKYVSDTVKDMQKCAEGKMRESKLQVSKLEEAAEEAREEAENIKPGSNLEDAKELEERAKVLQDEARRKEEETEKLDRIRRALVKATLALAPTNVEKQVEESAKKVTISPAQAVRRLSKLEVAQKQTEQKEKKEELGETVEKLEDLINQYKIIEESGSPMDTDRKGLTSSRKTFEEPAAQQIRPKKDSGSVRRSQKKQSDPEAIIRSMVLAEMAREEEREPAEGPQEVSVTKVVLQHTLQQMRALARAILSAVDSSKDFDQRKAGMTPLDRKSETEQTQNQYEFARNGLLSVLAKPETTLLLNQRENLPILARAVKRESEKLVEISKEPENRDTLQVSTQEFYDALVPIKFDDKEEVEKIKEMIEGIKVEEKIKKDVDEMKEDLAKPKRDRTMAELIAVIKDDITKIDKLMKDPENKISPVEVKNMEKIAEDAKLLLSKPIPPAESILQVKKFARGGSVLLPEGQADIPNNLDKNNDKLAEMMLKEKEYQMKKAAEELAKSFAEKGIELKKDDAAFETKESWVLGPGNKLTKSHVGEQPRAASSLMESKCVLHTENVEKALQLDPHEKSQLEERLSKLKKAVEECVETAEEELFSKAVGVEGIVYERKFEESSNPMVDRMENKVKELKKVVDEGDRKDQIPHLVRDIVQANQRSLENKMGDGALLSPRKQGEVQECLDKLEKSAQSYDNIKKNIRDAMLPLIKKTEVLLGLKVDEAASQEGVIAVVAPSEGQPSSLVISEYGSKEPPRSDAEFAQPTIGGIASHHAEEHKPDSNDMNMRRNKKPRKIKEIAGIIEDDSRDFFSYNVFSEGENAEQIYDSQQFRPKVQQSSVEVHTDDKIDEESQNSSRDRSYGDRDHYTEQDSRDGRSTNRDNRLSKDGQPHSKSRYGEEEQNYDNDRYPSQSHRSQREHTSQRDPTSHSHRSHQTPRSAAEEHISKESRKSDQNRHQSDYPSFRKQPEDSAKEEEYFSDIFKKDGQQNPESEGRYSEYFNSKKGDDGAAAEPQNLKSNEFFSKGGRSESHRSEPVQKIQTHFVSPAKEVKPKRNKTYYMEDAVPNPGKKDKPLVPVLKPVVFPASSGSSESGPSDVESMESFYIERKKNGMRVYERKKRPLREGEANPQLRPVEGETMLSAVLQESSEWNRGKKVFKKHAALVDVKPPPQNEIKEKKLDYFDVIGVDEEAGERKVQQKETKVKIIKPTQDQIAKGLDKGPRYAIMLGADKEYKIIKLNDLDDNPLDTNDKTPLIPGATTSAPATSDSKLSTVPKTNSTGTEPIVNIVEKLPISFRDLPVFNEMRVKPVRSVSNVEGLQMFLRQLEAIPNAFVSVWEQTDEFMHNKPVVSQLYKISGPGVDKCNKILEGLAKDGKLSGVDPSESSKVGPSNASKTGATGKLDRTTASAKPGGKPLIPEPTPYLAPTVIEGTLLSADSATAQEGTPIYMLQENPDNNKLNGESDTTAAEDQAIRALEELKRALEKTGKISDVGGLYARVAKDGVESHPSGQKQMELVDELFQAVEQEAKRRGQVFDDCLFPPGAGSMVNNSLKSTEPYKSSAWEATGNIFEVDLT